MRSILKTPLFAAAALIALGFAVPGTLSAQSASIPVDEAREFLGQWSLEISGAQGEQILLSIDIQDADGQVAAEVAADGLAQAVAVESITRSGSSLILGFTPMVQGQPIPVEITLTPAGENLDASVIAADGMFAADGTATPA